MDFSNSNLDVDGDNVIDSVIFYVSQSDGYAELLYSENWAVGGNSTVKDKNGTKRLSNYICIAKPNLNFDSRRTVTHEFSHNIGFPDMYTYPSCKPTFPEPAGGYTMLCDNTGYPTVWERIKYGQWISESNIKTIEAGKYSLKDVTWNSTSNRIAYKICPRNSHTNSDEFFMVEYRNKNANCIENMIPESGILVYRVDPNQTGNGDGDPEVYVLRNPGQTVDEGILTGASGRNSVDLVFKSGEKTGYKIQYGSMSGSNAEFELVSTPIVKYTSLVEGKFNVENMSYDGELSGTEGQGKRIEKLYMDVSPIGKIYFRAFTDGNWTNWTLGNNTINSRGKDIEAIQIKLDGELAKEYDIYYRAHNRYYGWFGWTKNGDTAGAYKFGSAIEGLQVRLVKKGTTVNGVTNDTKLSSKNKEVKHTVKFKDNNGVDLKTETVCHGDSATAPLVSNKFGYTFKGWDKSFDNVTSDLTVNAKYEIKKYTVTFCNEDGSVIETQKVNHGEDAKPPIANKAGYIFTRWEGNYKSVYSDRKIVAKYRKVINIKSFSFNKSRGVVGSEVSLNVNLENAKSDVKCIFLAQGGNSPYGSKDFYFSMSSVTSGKWIPTVDGNYTIFVDITSEGRTERKYIGNYKVLKEGEDKTTIYYRGYNNPKIHYQIGNGQWTSGNGISMTSCTDVPGYYYSISIDLGDASGITACFNNGANSWDNNNNQNYKFGAGYYTFSNGTITKIEKPSSELKINSITSSSGSTIKYGSTVDIKINASGGEGPYTYYLYYYAYGSGRANYIINGASYNQASYTPDYPRNTILYAEVIDKTGKKVIAQQSFDVKEIKSNQITIYYNGFNNPNIHYQIGNNEWTKGFGVSMEKNSEMPRYYYKKIIDLGDETTLTACFNNGSAWDNNGNRNYHFNGPGVYTFDNGIIKKIQ